MCMQGAQSNTLYQANILLGYGWWILFELRKFTRLIMIQ